jgi:hypothetical protein
LGAGAAKVVTGEELDVIGAGGGGAAFAGGGETDGPGVAVESAGAEGFRTVHVTAAATRTTTAPSAAGISHRRLLTRRGDGGSDFGERGGGPAVFGWVRAGRVEAEEAEAAVGAWPARARAKSLQLA